MFIKSKCNNEVISLKNYILTLKNKILSGEKISFEEAKTLIEIKNSEEDLILFLSNCANDIRKHFCGDTFDLCTIMNAKSGKCSEDCRYCAQSSFYKTKTPIYSLVSKEEALKLAKSVEKDGAHRFSLVTSGKGLFSEKSSLELTEIYRYLNKNSNIKLCASHGILNLEAAKALKEAGVTRYHHNLETSRDFYPKICSTHTYQDRVDTIIIAKKVGMEVCSGGIFGLGESPIDRIKMAFDLAELEIKSIPLNFLTPIPGTPLENSEAINPIEIIKTIAVYRFILPDATIRYAGGRLQLEELELQGFRGGINGALTGNFLTTTGSTISSDKEKILKEGFKLEYK